MVRPVPVSVVECFLLRAVDGDSRESDSVRLVITRSSGGSITPGSAAMMQKAEGGQLKDNVVGDAEIHHV